jgi:hypothetical protein
MSSGALRRLSFDTSSERTAMQKLTTWLWFETEAEQAAEFYASIFPDSLQMKKIEVAELERAAA